MPAKTIRQSLNKAFLKAKPNRSQIDDFKKNLQWLLENVSETESEEHHKNQVADFLKNTYFSPDYYINTKDYKDQVIHNGKSAKHPVAVIIEAKSPSNKSEMPEKGKLNRKAVQELLLYYLRERVGEENLQVKHLIVTNLYEWFIFDSQQFEKHFAQNKKLVKHFKDFEEKGLSGTKTDFFYKEIAAPAIEAVQDQLEFTHFSLKSYLKPLQNDDPGDDAKLIRLYKVLSPEHLLKLPFANDSNSLNRSFYTELLHLIGLKEEKQKGKKLIQRLPTDQRNDASLLENTINQLEALDFITRLDNPKQYGSTSEERYFNVALELVITWINRVLFLKLLEAQLLSYHKGDKNYSFLNSKLIHDFDDLNTLFFQVLAKKLSERSGETANKFKHVPYLNSSLFDPTELEYDTIRISSLQNELKLPLLSSTVLKDRKGKREKGERNTLQYLFDFLNAYDFSSEGGEEIQEENKTLINASVLGLIFEKINGYRDGSFFTPGFITTYMSRESIRRAVLQKFNEAKGWDCEDFTDLHNQLGSSKEERNAANAIINSLKICDPAVGSGHFLVSALNEIIAIKAELKLLQDKEGRTLRDYNIIVENDELIITDENDDFFEYKPGNRESQRVQETLFHEKQQIIESCLFGVDINPNSVKICRLRLWIELLKNAYYKTGAASSSSSTESGAYRELETLPNIDINIKCGNSLISRFALDADLKKALKKSKWSIEGYRSAVLTYQHAESKDQKREMEKLIADIKGDFRTEIQANDPKVKRLYKVEGEVTKMLTQQQMFQLERKEKAAYNKKMKKLSGEVERLRQQIEEIKNNAIYDNAFEWRFEFPEVLDDKGEFIGFDVIIGNPPYIRHEELKDVKSYLHQQYDTFTNTADLYVPFVERGMSLLNKQGQFIYILPNKWMRAGYGDKLRQYLQRQNIESIVDFGDLPVFEEATTYPCIMRIEKAANNHRFESLEIKSLDFEESLEAYVQENAFEVDSRLLQPSGWTLTDVKVQKLLEKLRSKGKPLGDYVDGKIYRGVLTGLNEAFVIDSKTREKLIEEDPKSEEVIKPFLAGRDIKRYKQPESDKFLIFTRRGIKIEKYPAILKYLEQYKARLMPKPKDYKGRNWPGRKPGTYKWHEIQDAVDYYDEFENEKIIYPNICKRPEFTNDTNGQYTNQKCFIIPGGSKYLLGILNSKMTFFLFKNILPMLRGDFYEPSYRYFKDFPIMDSSSVVLEEKVTRVLELKQKKPTADTGELEAEIDRLVYELYGLSEEEVRIIEASTQ